MRLALDTAFSACSVALADASGKILASAHLKQHRGQAESLIPMIERVLEDAGKSVGEVREIVLMTGPGTFAGVRIGVACARAIALANNAKIFGLSSFEALAGLAFLRQQPLEDTKILTLVPGKRGEVSFQVFSAAKLGQPPFVSDSGAETILEKELIIPDSALVSAPAFDSGLEQALSAHTRITAWPCATDLLQIAAFFPPKSFRETVSPFYLRPPDAMLQKPPLARE